MKESQGISRLNEISTKKNLKVKIPQIKKSSSINDISSSNNQQEIQSVENLSKKNSFFSNADQGENNINISNENFTKFPLIIDETVKDTREFIKFLQELNKKDLSSQDKKRMENYLSKSISEVQKKISDDIQKMNKN